MRRKPCVDRLGWIGRKSQNSPNTETGRIWSGHVRHANLQRHILHSAAHWLLGMSGARQADGSTGRTLGSHPNSQQSRWEDEHPNFDRCVIRDERGIAHRGALEQGPNGDLRSILFQLIDERSGVTDFIKVKSHLEDAGPSIIKQNKIAFHHMLANSVADVVAEEAAKRMLPDLNLERKVKRAERIGVGVAKRLVLVQADIWAKRSEAGHIYELDPLLVEEATCTRTVLSTLVDEFGSPRSLTGTSQQRSAMQIVQCVQRQHRNS